MQAVGRGDHIRPVGRRALVRRAGRRRGQGRHSLAGQHQRPELERARLRDSEEPRGHGFATAYSENVADADEAEALRDYASQGYNIVMGHSGRFVSAMEQVAPDFPDTQFIAVSGNEGMAPNVMSIDWNNAQFGCQLGTLAARMSKTHKVAGVYGLQGVPNITAQAGGFRICANKAGADVTILYIKDMEDAAEAKEAALSLIAQGADVITGKLNAAEAGLVQAAKEKNVYVTGRGFDQTKIAPDLVLTNIIEDWPGMFGSTADDLRIIVGEPGALGAPHPKAAARFLW